MKRYLLIFNYASIVISFILGIFVNKLFYWFLMMPLSTSIILQLKFYNRKNHIALSIFYIFTLMIPFPLEKIVEISLRSKYNRLAPKVFKLLNDEKIKFHAVFGTFLFAYRNNNFKDNDIDLGIWKSDWSDSILIKMKNAGFILHESYFLDGEIREHCFKHKNMSISLDIFIINDINPNGIGFDFENNRYCTKPKSFKYSLKQYVIGDTHINAPKEAEEYLSWLYGEWRKPDPNYHWFYGPTSSPNKIVQSDKIKVVKNK
ncbi:MAG: hypothetical protein HRT99_00690 [Mycoplasmatales bacterium]|nr:hypothetical protein [Mycoplasmatales bacterium]